MRNYLKLGLWCLGLYVFFAHFTPAIIPYFPSWQAYLEKADELGIETGALYYTDVPVVSDAERATRQATIDAYGHPLGWKTVEKDPAQLEKEEDKKELAAEKASKEKEALAQKNLQSDIEQ